MQSDCSADGKVGKEEVERSNSDVFLRLERDGRSSEGGERTLREETPETNFFWTIKGREIRTACRRYM